MAQIGCLGDIVFKVSSDEIKTINNAVWSGSARHAEHKRHLTHALTEFTGIDADKFSFDIELSLYLGVDPMMDIIKIWDYERSGTPLTFVLGEKIYGKHKWTIINHKIKLRTFDGKGNMTGATVSLDLLEYLRG